MNWRTVIISLFLAEFFHCSSGEVEEAEITGFDISPDDTEIIFSFSEGGKALLYSINSEGGIAKQIFVNEENISRINPRFSPDGQKILFLKYKNGDFSKTTLCISKPDGSKIESHTEKSGIITEAIFSINGRDIIFCKAMTYVQGSPIVMKRPHDFDLYSLDWFNGNVVKLSNVGAYGIHDVSEVDSSFVIFRLDEGPKDGLYAFDKKAPLVLKKIVPANNPRGDEGMYYDPVYDSRSNTLLFTAPYELYRMNLEDKLAQRIYDSRGTSNISSVRLFKKSPRILFAKQGENKMLYSINLDGTDLKQIVIKFE